MDTHEYFKWVTQDIKALPLWEGLSVGTVTFHIKHILKHKSDNVCYLFQTHPWLFTILSPNSKSSL